MCMWFFSSICFHGLVKVRNIRILEKNGKLKLTHVNQADHMNYDAGISGGFRNIKTGGRGPGAVEFLGLGFVLMPLHTYPKLL